MRMSTITPMFPYRLTPGVEDALSLFDRSAVSYTHLTLPTNREV